MTLQRVDGTIKFMADFFCSFCHLLALRLDGREFQTLDLPKRTHELREVEVVVVETAQPPEGPRPRQVGTTRRGTVERDEPLGAEREQHGRRAVDLDDRRSDRGEHRL